MKRVLFLAYNFPPMGGGGVQRTLKFVKYLPRFGWEPVVICADDRAYWARDETLTGEIPPEIVIKRRRPMGPGHIFTILGKLTSRGFARRVFDNIFVPDDRILWALTSVFTAIRLIKRLDIDLIYSTSPPHSTHIGAGIIKRLTGLPWVADFRDPWTGNFRYNPNSPQIRKLHKKKERKILNSADRVICITESVKNKYISDFGISPDRLVTIYNGFDPDDFDKEPVRDKEIEDRIVITHSGSFYGTYFPKDTFPPLSKVINDYPSLKGRVEVRFIGVMDSEIQDAISDTFKGNAVFLGYVAHKEAIRTISRSDINLITLPMTGDVSYIVTGKLFEYLAAKRPILAVVPPGEAARLITEARAGIVVHENDPEKLSDALYRAILELKDREDFSPVQDVVHRFERGGLTSMLAGVFNELVDGE